MSNSYNATSQQSSPSLLGLDRYSQRQLLKAFWILAGGLFVFELFFTQTASLISNFGSILITAAALVPLYLWCSGRALGLPVFPLLALTYLWTFALPLVSNHPKVIEYSPASHLFASVTTAGFLLLGTLVWFQFVKSAPPTPKAYLALQEDKGDLFFMFALAASTLFNIANTGGWLLVDGGIFSLLRSVALGLSALSAFTLSYRLGIGALSKQKARVFLVLLLTAMITSAVNLLLVGAASTFLIATAAFTIGRKKLPILLIVIVLVCLSMLHYGKSEMRAKYWFMDQPTLVQPWQYPAWFGEWIGYGLDYTRSQNSNSGEPEKASFLQRSSVIHILLLAQDKSPQHLPFMNGETYSILPQVIIPRVFNPNKIRSHEGTYLLNIHYGLQTREATFTTTIGWGLLAEAYANFGLLGCTGLAIILGAAYGQATRWSVNSPILSARSLFSVLMMTFAFQTEWSAGVYIAALFQSSVTLLGIVVVLMKPRYVSLPPSYTRFNYPPSMR